MVMEHKVGLLHCRARCFNSVSSVWAVVLCTVCGVASLRYAGFCSQHFLFLLCAYLCYSCRKR